MISLVCPRCETRLYIVRGKETTCSCGEHVRAKKGLGALTADALSSVGITKERVNFKEPGKPCKGCQDRERKLDNLSFKVMRVKQQSLKDGRHFSEVRPVSTVELVAVTIKMIPEVHELKPTAIVGIPRSGMIPASILAAHLHVPLGTISPEGEIVMSGNGFRSKAFKELGENPVIVDDTIHNGHEMRKYVDYLRVAAYAKPASAHLAHVYGELLESPHVLEWNIVNCPFVTVVGFDMDGFICEDCSDEVDDDAEKYVEWMTNAKPFHLPRKGAPRAIITARLEKYRKLTEEWLMKHEVSCQHLIMHPAKSLKERNASDVPRWKAEWADKLGCEIFVESDVRMASAIDRHAKFSTPVAFK